MEDQQRFYINFVAGYVDPCGADMHRCLQSYTGFRKPDKRIILEAVRYVFDTIRAQGCRDITVVAFDGDCTLQQLEQFANNPLHKNPLRPIGCWHEV